MRAPQIGFDQLVQDFFLRRLIDQRGASARTVESYRTRSSCSLATSSSASANRPRS